MPSSVSRSFKWKWNPLFVGNVLPWYIISFLKISCKKKLKISLLSLAVLGAYFCVQLSFCLPCWGFPKFLEPTNSRSLRRQTNYFSTYLPAPCPTLSGTVISCSSSQDLVVIGEAGWGEALGRDCESQEWWMTAGKMSLGHNRTDA